MFNVYVSKKFTLFMLVSILATIVLVACGSDEPEVVEVTRVVVEEVASDPEIVEVTRVVEVEGETQTIIEVVTATPEPEAPAAPKPTGDLVLWGWAPSVFYDTGLIDEFAEEYPDINIEWINYGAGDTYQNLQLALIAGDGGPDLVQVENSHLAQFVELGGLADMTAQVEPYHDIMNEFKWDAAEKDGKYYAMPWDSGPVVLFYRRDVLEQAGLASDPESVSDLVATWDDYYAMCETIVSETGFDCFAQNKANNYGRLFIAMLWQQGISLYNDAGEVTVDSPEAIATLNKLGEFWDADLVSDELDWSDGWSAQMNSFDNPVATHVEAAWHGNFLKTWLASDTAGQWGVVPMPALESGQTRSANSGGSTLAILEESENKEAAWAFVEFMLGRNRSQLLQLAAYDFFPALETTYNDPLFVEGDAFYGGQSVRQVFYEAALEIPQVDIYGPNYNLMEGHIGTAVQNYAVGNMTAEEALQEAANAIRLETGME